MGIWQLAHSLRLFLFEEAAESAYGSAGFCPCASALGEPAAGSAGAAKLDFSMPSRKTANIGMNFGSGSRAMNQGKARLSHPFASTGARP